MTPETNDDLKNIYVLLHGRKDNNSTQENWTEFFYAVLEQLNPQSILSTALSASVQPEVDFLHVFTLPEVVMPGLIDQLATIKETFSHELLIASLNYYEIANFQDPRL